MPVLQQFLDGVHLGQALALANLTEGSFKNFQFRFEILDRFRRGQRADFVRDVLENGERFLRRLAKRFAAPGGHESGKVAEDARKFGDQAAAFLVLQHAEAAAQLAEALEFSLRFGEVLVQPFFAVRLQTGAFQKRRDLGQRPVSRRDFLLALLVAAQFSFAVQHFMEFLFQPRLRFFQLVTAAGVEDFELAVGIEQLELGELTPDRDQTRGQFQDGVQRHRLPLDGTLAAPGARQFAPQRQRAILRLQLLADAFQTTGLIKERFRDGCFISGANRAAGAAFSADQFEAAHQAALPGAALARDRRQTGAEVQRSLPDAAHGNEFQLFKHGGRSFRKLDSSPTGVFHEADRNSRTEAARWC